LRSARNSLIKNFVAENLGFGHISRESIIADHTRPLAQQLFGQWLNKAILVLDGTYIYTQKSKNFSFSRQSYSMYKHRPLIKPMMIVSTTGYIIAVLGPYIAKNSDADIIKHMVRTNTEEFNEWVAEGDVMVVDRGFRDAKDILEELGLEVEMPSFLGPREKQYTTADANKSRLVTKVLIYMYI
jgi:hypothetical protein